ncbi:putative receptor-like protein kinase At3g47110 [Chenopodium quinoa]|uniref:putative receptor-like protein kinase At3g47110 n=1 Tax=Chenopodium quinoa TaxID=63459 RepID=UPI000B778D04|nr:putative receptor-like protein kinase At3g47110 [Chenopodium quinoa]
MNPTSKLTLVFILLIHILSLFNSVFPYTIDHVALLAIKSQIILDPRGVLNTWNNSLPYCEWEGVTCSTKHPHRVVGLNLQNNNLVGTLSPYVGNLSFLHVLNLYNNSFRGHIPPQIGNLLRLRSLELVRNTFEGEIPANISRCLNLEQLQLSGNNLGGFIPSQLSILTKLLVLSLSYNQLKGDILNKVVMNMTSLQILLASNNSFHGSIPENIGVALQNLVYIYMSGNKISGKFIFSARNMPNLLYVEINSNYLGTREADDLAFLQTFANCSNLYRLEASFNNFGGILPASLGNIPLSLYNLTNLRVLGLQGNQFTGNLSPQIQKLTKLELFDYNDNYLSGNLPNSWENLSHLSEVNLANNRFEGTIPSSLGSCTNLLYLTLSNNRLSGTLPPQLFHLSSMLVELRLSYNQLQGVIPVEIEQLRNLVLLDISGNAFSGKFPTTLGSCNELIELDIGGNLFTRFIPPSFKSLTSLRFLNLSHNKLSGPIPNFFENFSLIGLDLSYNDFKGEVPRKGVFANLSALKILGNNKICGGISQLQLPTCPPNNVSRGKGIKLSVAVIAIIAVASLVASVSIVSLVYFLLCSRRKRNKPSQGSEFNLIEPFSISYDKLLKATDRFSEANVLGKGHFGSVYKGVIDHESNNMVVAVKIINLEQRGAAKSFMAECETLRSIRHRNLLKIVTVCSSTDFQGNDFKALVYEFMTNESLHQWIHTDPYFRRLSLLQRVAIAIDVASALDCLHNGCDTPIIHCDLKPSNILLDDSMVAHVGDFGLARFHLRATANNSSSIAVKGIVGYAPPEYGLGSMVSKEGDIYSFGIVLLEMMTSKSPTDEMFERGLDLHNYANSAALSAQLENIIDPRLLEDGYTSEGNEGEILIEIDRKHKCIKSIIEIGVKCSVESPQDRMRIEDAIGELQVLKDALLKQLHVIRAKRV